MLTNTSFGFNIVKSHTLTLKTNQCVSMLVKTMLNKS